MVFMVKLRKIFLNDKPVIVAHNDIRLPRDIQWPAEKLAADDFPFLIAYYASDKSDPNALAEYKKKHMKSRTTEWRRRKRLKKLGYI